MYVQAQKIVENALNMFEKLEQVRPTKSSILGFILGQLLAKKAYIEAELALTSQDRDERVLAACQVFSAEMFLYPISRYICSFACSFIEPLAFKCAVNLCILCFTLLTVEYICCKRVYCVTNYNCTLFERILHEWW